MSQITDIIEKLNRSVNVSIEENEKFVKFMLYKLKLQKLFNTAIAFATITNPILAFISPLPS